jgi:hypothetical protein
LPLNPTEGVTPLCTPLRGGVYILLGDVPSDLGGLRRIRKVITRKPFPSHGSLKSKGSLCLIEMKKMNNIVYLPRTRQQGKKGALSKYQNEVSAS